MIKDDILKPTSFATSRTLTAPLLTGVGRAFGVCGELAQGQFDSGEDFLVTLPVDVWSEAQVTIDPASPEIRGDAWNDGLLRNAPVSGQPRESCRKTSLAIRRALDCLGFPRWGAVFRLQSGLPEGKGMASSSADITAACRAVSAALNLPLTAEQISEIAISIEPTDGVMYAGVVCYNHRKGRLLETLGNIPPASLLVVDLGAQVDTVAFNQIPKNYTAAEREKIQRAYYLIRSGIRSQDLAQVGLGATLSAEVNQRLLPKPHFETIVRIAREQGASGVCAAHSGSVLGLLFAPRAAHRIPAAQQSICNAAGKNIHQFRTAALDYQTIRL